MGKPTCGATKVSSRHAPRRQCNSRREPSICNVESLSLRGTPTCEATTLSRRHAPTALKQTRAVGVYCRGVCQCEYGNVPAEINQPPICVVESVALRRAAYFGIGLIDSTINLQLPWAPRSYPSSGSIMYRRAGSSKPKKNDIFLVFEQVGGVATVGSADPTTSRKPQRREWIIGR